MAKEDFWRRREEEFRMMEEEEKNMLWGNMASSNLASTASAVQPPPPMMMRRPDSSDDKHVIAKHGQIFPTDDQLASIQKQVSTHILDLFLASFWRLLVTSLDPYDRFTSIFWSTLDPQSTNLDSFR